MIDFNFFPIFCCGPNIFRIALFGFSNTVHLIHSFSRLHKIFLSWCPPAHAANNSWADQKNKYVNTNNWNCDLILKIAEVSTSMIMCQNILAILHEMYSVYDVYKRPRYFSILVYYSSIIFNFSHIPISLYIRPVNLSHFINSYLNIFLYNRWLFIYNTYINISFITYLSYNMLWTTCTHV